MDVLSREAMPPPPGREDHVHSGVGDLHAGVDLFAGPNHLVVSLLDKGRALLGGQMVKQFLLASIHPLWATESFEVGTADVRDDRDVGLDDRREVRDLARGVRADLDEDEAELA